MITDWSFIQSETNRRMLRRNFARRIEIICTTTVPRNWPMPRNWSQIVSAPRGPFNFKKMNVNILKAVCCTSTTFDRWFQRKSRWYLKQYNYLKQQHKVQQTTTLHVVMPSHGWTRCNDFIVTMLSLIHRVGFLL